MVIHSKSYHESFAGYGHILELRMYGYPIQGIIFRSLIIYSLGERNLLGVGGHSFWITGEACSDSRTYDKASGR